MNKKEAFTVYNECLEYSLTQWEEKGAALNKDIIPLAQHFAGIYLAYILGIETISQREYTPEFRKGLLGREE